VAPQEDNQTSPKSSCAGGVIVALLVVIRNLDTATSEARGPVPSKHTMFDFCLVRQFILASKAGSL
jgi:hypothetical protein